MKYICAYFLIESLVNYNIEDIIDWISYFNNQGKGEPNEKGM